ncbi:sigma factor-like helix-turn-helix DNA-binding protein [Luteibacter sp. SG786]|uniref:sigma factor-like helix-turn-helix DNA-binding protein n=1 Tax=Luteibacter sp. SG786 TaxID=2587130 RepID=UPI00141D83DA|nr:sigma factor-like helix-turn-helix DNA-binding protein [Luteibacter sp. SG786]NII54830.1 DNA-directed RNA polymerase specialized sigma24 family protein [Luteibacter sp. SG786]
MDPHTSVYESLRRQLSTKQPLDAVFVGLLDTLEALPPDARVAFLMSDIFEAGIDEVSLLLRRDAAACRELLRVARSFIQEAGVCRAPLRNEDQS